MIKVRAEKWTSAAGICTLRHGQNFTKPFTFQARGALNTTFFAHLGEYGTYPQDGFNLDVIPNVSPDILAGWC